MLCFETGLSFKALVFQHIAVLLLTHNSEGFSLVPFCIIGKNLKCLFFLSGNSQVVGQPSQIVALVGNDAILPCQLEPAADAVNVILEWGRLDLKPRFVHLWHEGQNRLVSQNPSYRGRTSLSIDKLKHGDLSLTLFKVKLSDSGTYRCLIPKMNKESAVELIVGSVSSPVIAGINISSDREALQCESKGWYPEPEMLWLDGEGNLLSAGPTETVRGPDGLYTVSSRLTVEERHSSSFTCRVQQKNINQTRETHLQTQISAECYTNSSNSAARIIIVVSAICICVLAVFVMWKWSQGKAVCTMTRDTKDENEKTGQKDLLMTESKKNDLDQVVPTIVEQKQELEKWIKQLKRLKEEMETKAKETEEKLGLMDVKSLQFSLFLFVLLSTKIVQ
uniref:V-set domain-containing T-cell activation inhibitor 1-like n=1 Tax=Semicossyphus pulcher TaxID=241346 RepID=UPI0037E813CC